jgi:hypothetical protein
MVNVDDYPVGTYSLHGDEVVLHGTSKFTLDDGYAKTSGTRNINYKLKLSGTQMTLEGDPWADLSYFHPRPPLRVVFWRAGTEPTHHLAREPKAVAILQKVEKAYATAKTYSDAGSLTTSGKGFESWKVTFRTRFLRSKAYAFDATIWERGKRCEEDSVWTNGKFAWFSSSHTGKSQRMSFYDSLGFIQNFVGSEARLVSLLLNIPELHSTLRKAMPGVTFGGEGDIGGRRCTKLNLFSSEEDDPATIWIDDSTHLILKATEPFGGTIIYHPVINAPIPLKELTGQAVPFMKSVPHHLAP